MKIIRWSKDRITDDSWSAPVWVKEALKTGLAFAYLLIDEEQDKVAAWAVCYIDDDQLEIISLGQDTTLTSRAPLERILRKIGSFCQEREISTAEVELLDVTEEGPEASLIRSDYVKTVDDNLWKLQRLPFNASLGGSYEIKALNDLSSQEKASLIQLLKGMEENIPQFRGGISSELELAAVKNAKVEACIFASRYRGAIFVEQLVCKNDEAGREAWKAICKRTSDAAVLEEIYTDDKVYSEKIFGQAQRAKRQVYTWKEAAEGQLTARDLEVELNIRDENANALDALFLTKIYLLADIFTEEEIENYMAVDTDIHPKLFAVIRGAESEYIMNVKPILDDMDAGLFRYEITTSFPGNKNKVDRENLCGAINERISEGTVYLSTTKGLILRNYVPELVFTDDRLLNRLLHNWYESCQIVSRNI